jgi:hypothetical protein
MKTAIVAHGTAQRTGLHPAFARRVAPREPDPRVCALVKAQLSAGAALPVLAGWWSGSEAGVGDVGVGAPVGVGLGDDIRPRRPPGRRGRRW